MQEGGGIVITHNVSKRPDRIRVKASGDYLDPDNDAEQHVLSYLENSHGDFYFDENKLELSYLGKSACTPWLTF